MPWSGDSLKKWGQVVDLSVAAKCSPWGPSSITVYNAKLPGVQRPPEQSASQQLLKTGLQMYLQLRKSPQRLLDSWKCRITLYLLAFLYSFQSICYWHLSESGHRAGWVCVWPNRDLFSSFSFFFTFLYSETLEEEIQCTCLEPMHIFSPKFTHALLCVHTYPVFAFLSCPRN